VGYKTETEDICIFGLIHCVQIGGDVMLTLLNPNIDDFMACPVSFRLVERKPLVKYGYLIKEQIRRFGSVDVLVDGTISSLFPHRMFGCLPKVIRHLDFRGKKRILQKLAIVSVYTLLSLSYPMVIFVFFWIFLTFVLDPRAGVMSLPGKL